MPKWSVPSFVYVLSQSNVLDPSKRDILTRQVQGRYSDAELLGSDLVRLGWLTEFQREQLMEGNGELLTLGPYRILDWLGEGGVSQVFRAYHVDHEREVALKVLRPALQQDPEALRQFHFEVNVMSRLSHPNIVSAVDADPVAQPCFYSMEFVDGTDLGKLVDEGGPLSLPRACDYVRQAALGLQHAHERGVVHRDIKPANLLLMPNGVVKVLDMGLARLEWVCKGSYNGTPEDTANLVMGTPDFIAPEQATCPEKTDTRADIYSLGCTLYFLLSGKPPFPVKSVAQKLVCHQTAEPTPIEKLVANLPAAFPPVLRKMMAKAPPERFRAPAAVGAALRPFCRAEVIIRD